MAENKIAILVGDQRVLSELTYDDSSSSYRVTSSCGDYTQTDPITVLMRPGYTADQLEYDIEVRRHELAGAAAGSAAVKSLLAGSITAVDQIPEVTSGPRIAKPVTVAETKS